MEERRLQREEEGKEWGEIENEARDGREGQSER